MSGGVARRHLKELAGAHGEGVLRAVLESLEPEARDELDPGLSIPWVRVATVEAFYAEAARQLSCDVGDLHRELGRLCVEQTFRTVWRALLRLTSDEALIARTPVIYSKTYDVGSLTSRMVAPGVGEATLSGWPEPPRFVRRGLCIGISTVLTLAGRKNATVTESWHRDGAVFQLRWLP